MRFHSAEYVSLFRPTRANFVVTPSGTAYPVPRGATGSVPNINKAGTQTGVKFEGGSGGENGNVGTMRIMNPTTRYPNGYIKYDGRGNSGGVNPYTGQPIPNTQNHFPID